MPRKKSAEDIHSSKKPKVSKMTAIDDVAEIGQFEGIKLVKDEAVPFTFKFAESILEHEEFSADRSLDSKHVAKLLDAMRQGAFLAEQATIIVCEYDGVCYRMNGQHTCWARVYYEENPNYRPKIRYFHYKAKTEDDMRKLYATIDRGKARSRANVIDSILYGTAAYADFNKQTLKRISQGLSTWLWGFAKVSEHSPDELAHLMKNDWYDLCLKVGHLIKDVSKPDYRHLHRSPVFKAMFETMRKAEGDSRKFWIAVAVGAELKVDDPRWKLREFLMKHSVNAGRGGGSYKDAIPGDDMRLACIDAWNAWRSGTTLKRKLGRETIKLKKKVFAK